MKHLSKADRRKVALKAARSRRANDKARKMAAVKAWVKRYMNDRDYAAAREQRADLKKLA
jgi:hypothetical protein